LKEVSSSRVNWLHSILCKFFFSTTEPSEQLRPRSESIGLTASARLCEAFHLHWFRNQAEPVRQLNRSIALQGGQYTMDVSMMLGSATIFF
jgi:hypothetical protein